MRLLKQAFLIVSAFTLITSMSASARQADCPGAPAPRLILGGDARVTPGNANNVRDSATVNGTLLGQIPGGETITVIGGSVCADGYRWWQVAYGTLTGWTVEGQGDAYFLEPVAAAPAPAEAESRLFQGFQPLDQHIAFSYPTSIGEGVRSQIFPVAESEADMIGRTPEYVQLTFERYNTPENRWADTGTIMYIYRISTMTEDMNLFASVNGLQTALAERPDKPNIRPMLTYPGPLVFTARERYIDTPVLSGVEFLMATSFDVSPVTQDTLRYLFQGISADGQYAVTIISPVQTALIPASIPVDFDYNAFFDTFDAYLTELESTLGAAADTDFTPALTDFDSVISTLTINSPAIEFSSAAGAPIQVDFNSYHVTVDASLGNRVQVDVIAATTDPEGMSSMFGSEPERTSVTIAGYPVRDMPYQQPQVFFMPTSTFAAGSNYANQLARVQDFVNQSPALVSGLPLMGEVTEIPFLPVYNAAQVMIVQPEYISFAGGRGVRFLTYYSQAFSVGTNGSVFYAFVGLTDDGSHVVSATFPISTAVLPDTFDYSAINPNSPDAGAILVDQVSLLAAEPAQAFTPSLDTLDALIASIRVD
ncbi:MAG: SH3 domain-containing protein [Pleurocapsa minor GSE-CHR-MK-17-07R]|jgi:hypothetical protein|nr:SH3 domain-containing protein [Pleurocapsa minor GSE-CHR-MK 17-07R]